MEEPQEIFTYDDKAAVFADSSSKNDINKPVIVFVHGLGGGAEQFFENNSMFSDAVESGFRAAVVNFRYPQGKSQDMWSNGKLLSTQLEDICGYFNVQKVIIVAHSKGGVDSQTAAVHYGASKFIDSIITLSTPHWGSQLADIAYSSAGWALAELVKAHSPGCFSMQTGCMREFRRITDQSPGNSTPIKTFAGNKGDDELTSMWFSSIILDRFGENDGVVTVESAHNPKGEHLGTYPLNHAQMSEGKHMWKHLEPVLKGEAEEQPAIAAMAVSRSTAPAHILKGGSLEKGADENFFIDSSVESFIFTITFSGEIEPNRFRLITPDNRRIILTAKKEGNSVVIYRAEVANPQPGKWRITASPCNGAYGAVICLSGCNLFHTSSCSAPPGNMEAELRILRTYENGYDVVAEYNFKKGSQLPKVPELKSGIFNIEMNLRGELEDGSIYERSVIRPITSGENLSDLLSVRKN